MFFKNPYIIQAETIEIIELVKNEFAKAVFISLLKFFEFFKSNFLKYLFVKIIQKHVISKYKIKIISIPIM